VTRYTSGRRAEWKARDYLRARGYYVIRSAGSKGLADLVAFKTGRPVLLVQVKYGGKSRAGAGASWIDDNWRRLVDMDANHELPHGVRAMAFIYQRGSTKPTIIVVGGEAGSGAILNQDVD